MNKSVIAIAVFSAVLFAGSAVSAEDSYGPPPPDQMMQDEQGPRDFERGERGERGDRGERDERGGRMGGKNMKGMMGMMGMPHQTVVATSDGGVVILSGGKLAKYDAGLNLVNEIEIKKDKEPKPAAARPAEAAEAPSEAPAAETPPAL
jgi:hypothetical protein